MPQGTFADFAAGRTRQTPEPQTFADFTSRIVTPTPASPRSTRGVAPRRAVARTTDIELPGEPTSPRPATFAESVGRGVDVAQQLAYGAVEAAGEATGLESVAAFGRQGRQRNTAQIAGQPRTALTDIEGVGDFFQWAKETIGEQIPIMAPMIVGSAAGAAVGSIVPGVGTTIGGVIGAVVPAVTFGVGEVQSAIKERGEDQSAPGMAFVGGSAIAALDSVLPAKVGSRLVRLFGGDVAEEIAKRALLKPVTTNVVRRSAKGAVEGLATEGLTEALQEAVGEVSAAVGTGTAISPDLPQQMLEAGAAGALVGGVAAGAVSAPSPRTRQPPPAPETFAQAAVRHGGQPADSPAAPMPPTVAAAPSPAAPAIPVELQGVTQDQRNALARAEAGAAGPASQDPTAIAAGRALERRVAAGVSPTGTERRTEVVDLTPPKAERDEHTFSSTQVNLPDEHAARVVAMAKAIPDEDIAADGRAGDSEGAAPHVTVKSGPTADTGLGTVRARAAAQVADPEALETLVDRYETTAGFANVVSRDNAKELFPDYASSPAGRTQYNEAVADAAGVVADHVYWQRLERQPSQSPGTVVLLSGGTGAGKTTVATGAPAARDADVVFDSQGLNADEASSRIEHALASGRTVSRIYVYRDPVEAWVNGVLPRAAESGRPVSIDGHVASHRDALTTAMALTEAYADHPRVTFAVVDNTGGRAKPIEASQATAFLRQAGERYNIADVHAQISRATEAARDAGLIEDALYEALTRGVLAPTGERRQQGAPEGRARGRDESDASSVPATPEAESVTPSPEGANAAPSASDRALTVLQDLEDAAKARIKKRGTFTGGRLSANLPVDDLGDIVIIGTMKIAKGTVQFAQWSAEMVREFGEAIRPHLKTIYDQARRKAEAFGPTPVRVESGRAAPPQKPIPDDRIHEFPSIQKMPAAIRSDIEEMLQRYHGFEQQRRGVQSWDRTQELAKDLWLPLETLKPGKALNAEELNAYQTAIATALTMRKPLLEKIRDRPLEVTDRDRLEASHLTDVATVLTASYRGAKAEAGRALNILRAKARVLDLRESAFLERALKAPGFSGDLTRLSKEALDAAGDPLKQLQILRRRSATWLFDYAQAIYYANLLSGIKTHERNLIGNSFNVLANAITPLGAVPADMYRVATQGGERSIYASELPHTVAGSFVGLDRGIRNAWFTFVEGFRPSMIEAAAAGRFDEPRVELPGGLKNPFNYPGRALEAADEFFRAIAYHQELYAGAYAQARTEGVSDPRRIADRMATLFAAVDRSTADGKAAASLFDRADEYAARAVFQEEPGYFINTLMTLKSRRAPKGVRAAATLIVPFMRITGAITRQGFEWSPLGRVMRHARASEPDLRVQAQARGRALLGSLALLPVAWLAATGRLTGAPPDDPGDREEFYAQGKLTNAVKVGSYWVRYVLFQPFSIPMSAVANAWGAWQESQQDEAAAQEAFMAGLAGAAKSVLDQSFLSGLESLQSAIDDPKNAQRWLSLFVQGLVPFSGAMRNIAQATDATYRKPTGVVEGVQAIIPGASKNLIPRRTRFGEEAQAKGPWWRRGFLVPEVSKAVDDEVTTTLARLGVKPTTPQPALTLRGEKVTLTREQQDVLIEALGREGKVAIETMIRGSRFSTRPDEVQREILERAMAVSGRSVRERAVRAIVRKDPFTVDRLVSGRVLEALARDRAAALGSERREGAGARAAR